LTVVNQLVVNG